jgi:hypothetical protein
MNSPSKAANCYILAENIRPCCDDVLSTFREPHLSYVTLNVSVFEQPVMTRVRLLAVRAPEMISLTGVAYLASIVSSFSSLSTRVLRVTFVCRMASVALTLRTYLSTITIFRICVSRRKYLR